MSFFPLSVNPVSQWLDSATILHVVAGHVRTHSSNIQLRSGKFCRCILGSSINGREGQADLWGSSLW